jgi:hypothetical protein
MSKTSDIRAGRGLESHRVVFGDVPGGGLNRVVRVDQRHGGRGVDLGQDLIGPLPPLRRQRDREMEQWAAVAVLAAGESGQVALQTESAMRLDPGDDHGAPETLASDLVFQFRQGLGAHGDATDQSNRDPIMWMAGQLGAVFSDPTHGGVQRGAGYRPECGTDRRPLPGGPRAHCGGRSALGADDLLCLGVDQHRLGSHASGAILGLDDHRFNGAGLVVIGRRPFETRRGHSAYP